MANALKVKTLKYLLISRCSLLQDDNESDLRYLG